LPEGAGPIRFLKDYGEITTLMLTIASPKASDVEIDLRARSIDRAIQHTRQSYAQAYPRPGPDDLAVAVCYPQTLDSKIPKRQRDLIADHARKSGTMTDIHPFEGNGFVGIIA